MAVDFVRDHIRDFLRDPVYLGPLREEPKRLYEVSGDAPGDVGVRGEFSPEMMLRASKAELFNEINRWLSAFGMPGRLFCHRLTETAFSLELDEGADSVGGEPTNTNFADVGFGFSQVLPLVVQGLAASEGTLLIAEQPEIHLNPRLQSVLAEFFAEIMNRSAAALAGLARGAYAAEAALSVARGLASPADSPFREALGELIRAAGLIRRIGVNLNQAVAKLNATGQRSGDLLPYAAESLRRVARLDAAAEEVRKRLR